jgi:KaiC/GvpD/RAD55 family RecA-like ATPase
MAVDLTEHSKDVTPRRRCQPYSFAELIKLPKREYLIKGLIDRGAMTLLYGDSGSGKTFLTLDLACHVALGWDWFERSVRQGTVYYLSAEGGATSIGRRLQAFELEHSAGLEETRLFIYPGAADLLDPETDVGAVLDELRRLDPVDLVVIDTLSRVLVGGNENAAEDMGRLVMNVDRIRAETGAHVLIVHHTGKDKDRGARGHSLLRAAVDTEIAVSHSEKNGGNIIVTKQRDHDVGDPFSFRLKSVELGVDDDGERITSCVAVQTEYSAGLQTRKLSGQRKRALDQLRNLVIDEGKSISGIAGIPDNVDVVNVDDWRSRCSRTGITDSEKPDSRRVAFNRAAEGLQDMGFIGVYDGSVWLIEQKQT